MNSSSEVALVCYRLQDSGEESFNKKDGVKRNAKNARGLTLTLTLTLSPSFPPPPPHFPGRARLIFALLVLIRPHYII